MNAEASQAAVDNRRDVIELRTDLAATTARAHDNLYDLEREEPDYAS